MKSKILLALAIFVGLGVFAFLDAKTTTSDDSKQAAVNKTVGTLRAFGSAEATSELFGLLVGGGDALHRIAQDLDGHRSTLLDEVAARRVVYSIQAAL